MDTVVLRDPEHVPQGLDKDYDIIIDLVNAGRTYRLSEYSVDVRKEKEIPFVPQGKCSNNITIRVNDSEWTIPGRSGGDPDLPPAVVELRK